MFGLFVENGPLRVEEGPKIVKADKSWADKYHMVYLDQPVGTGFSYGVEYHSDMDKITSDFESFVTLFLTMHELTGIEMHFAGQSYSGKYIPYFSHSILE